MSTFDGFVEEFPKIRIDCFRNLPKRPPPTIGFVSHVHTDHTVGLENFGSRFVYCSAVTRELLLNLEKKYYRLNQARGIFEGHTKHFKHLATRLRAIPLDTPTTIEIDAGEHVQVTLIDANHCVGSVMFLIQDDNKAILYTGDIRAERWWVHNVSRHSVLLPYLSGISRLDAIYLDTTFAFGRKKHLHFPSKAEGLKTLLARISKYPSSTTFYLHYWTFGYEEVWVALASFLKCKIHLCEYRYRLLQSLRRVNHNQDPGGLISSLCGFRLGNDDVDGVLTRDETARIHSCEKGTNCSIFRSSNQQVVEIRPVLVERDGELVEELGIGGGLGDVDRALHLELGDNVKIRPIVSGNDFEIHEDGLRQSFQTNSKDCPSTDVRQESRKNINHLKESFDAMSIEEEGPDLMTVDGPEQAKLVTESETCHQQKSDRRRATQSRHQTVHFPYSRHSSHLELLRFVQVFKPKRIVPCTASPAGPDGRRNEKGAEPEDASEACQAVKQSGPVTALWDLEHEHHHTAQQPHKRKRLVLSSAEGIDEHEAEHRDSQARSTKHHKARRSISPDSVAGRQRSKNSERSINEETAMRCHVLGGAEHEDGTDSQRDNECHRQTKLMEARPQQNVEHTKLARRRAYDRAMDGEWSSLSCCR